MRGRAQGTDQQARAAGLAPDQAAPAVPGARAAAPAASSPGEPAPGRGAGRWAAVLAAAREVPASRMQIAASVAALVAVALIFQVQTSLFLSPRNVTELLLESIQVGVMALGYCFGSFYTPSIAPEKRRKILTRLGAIGILLFIVLRWSNLYGDPVPWSVQPSSLFTFLSFLNTNKYPPSLLYLLMTLAPSMLFLAFTERVAGKVSGALIVIGRVPLFFYIVHIYVVHLVALIAAVLTGHPASHMVFDGWITNSVELTGYGFSLGVVYLVWILVIVVLYPLCQRYEQYKRNNKDKVWLSYL